MNFIFKSIGVIHTPYKKREGMPIQPFRSDAVGEVEVYSEYIEGLDDLEGFSHIMLLYIFHKSEGYKLKVKPFLDDEKRGLFATRTPYRPNPIGVSVVELLEVEGNLLKVKGVDVLDGTPLIDIKPCVPDFDNTGNIRVGWLEDKI